MASALAIANEHRALDRIHALLSLAPVEWVCECGLTFQHRDARSCHPDVRWNGRAYEHHHGYPIGHVAMRQARRGLLLREVADGTGLGIGYVQALLKKSTCVLKCRHKRWVADWADLEGYHHG